MTGRLSSRTTDAEALLARFNEASERALEAIGRGDSDALTRALDVRDEIQHEIQRATRDIALVRSRFAVDTRAASTSPRLVEQAVSAYCAPLDQLARAAQALQEQLESSANQLRAGLLGEIAALGTVAGAAARYSVSAAGESPRFDVVL